MLMISVIFFCLQVLARKSTINIESEGRPTKVRFGTTRMMIVATLLVVLMAHWFLEMWLFREGLQMVASVRFYLVLSHSWTGSV